MEGSGEGEISDLPDLPTLEVDDLPGSPHPPTSLACAGEPIVSCILRQLSEKATLLSENHSRLPWYLAKETIKLSRRLHSLSALLQGVDELGLIEDNPVVAWLAGLQSAVYDADHLFEEASWELEQLLELDARVELILHRWLKSAAACFLPCFGAGDHYPQLRRIASDMRNVCAKLDEAYETQKKLRFLAKSRVGSMAKLEIAPTRTVHGGGRHCQVDSHNVMPAIDRFFYPDSFQRPDLSFVALVGPAGIGKTKMAWDAIRSVHQNSSYLFKWLPVYGDLDGRRILEEISGELDRIQHDVSFEHLHWKLRRKLECSRLLIVLDDVRDCDRSRWAQLRQLLDPGPGGGAVLVTTRSLDVVDAMGPTTSFELDRVSDQKCWEIVKEHALVACQPHHVERNLKRMGWEISRKLQGNPFAASVIGGVLRFAVNEDVWRTILESELWQKVETEGSIIMPVLRLGYYHLPAHLKQCLLYCSVFPAGHRFRKENLVQMWLALGYVRAETHLPVRLVDVGVSYLEELTHRSFLQCIDGFYVMNHLMHELAAAISHRGRSLSIALPSEESNDLQSFEKSRIWLRSSKFAGASSRVPAQFFSHWRFLRVLDLNQCMLGTLPSSIAELKHLRYLDVSGNRLCTLPASIGKLRQLQTVKVVGLWLEELPSSITSLSNLCNLDADARVVSKLDGIARLSRLQQLELFCVGKNPSHNLGKLRNLKELGGELCIRRIENVENVRDATAAMLSAKDHLAILKLDWSSEQSSSRAKAIDEQVLENLCPPAKLKELRIRSNLGSKPPGWLERPVLSNVATISIEQCRNWKFLPPFGSMVNLKTLTLRGMEGIRSIGSEFYGNGYLFRFGKLEKLQFFDMPEWEEWENGNDGCFSCFYRLNTLVVRNCPKLKMLHRDHNCSYDPCPFPNLTNMEIRNCPLLDRLPCFTRSLKFLTLHEVGLSTFPVLQPTSPMCRNWGISNLQISNCPNWNHLPPTLSGLDSLTLAGCKRLRLLLEGFKDTIFCAEITSGSIGETASLRKHSIMEFYYLQSLCILDCPAISSLSEEALPNMNVLQTLYIDGCEGLVSLELTRFVSLKNLTVLSCPNVVVTSNSTAQNLASVCSSLEYVSTDNQAVLLWTFRHGFATLRSLRVVGCLEADNEDMFECLRCLEELVILECQELQLLPAVFWDLPSLSVLEIFDCPVFRRMPELWNFTSLGLLILRDCPGLESFPGTGLPLSLRFLSIKGCPFLIDGYREGAPNWTDISRIPELYLN